MMLNRRWIRALPLAVTPMACGGSPSEPASAGASETSERADAGECSGQLALPVQSACIGASFAECSDEQIAQILATHDKWQESAAEEFLFFAHGEDVRAFGTRAVNQYRRLDAAMKTVEREARITPIFSANSGAMAAAGAQRVTALRTLEGEKLIDDVYADQEILAAAQMLGLLEHVLIPSAQDPTFKDALIAAAQLLGQHLGEALVLQRRLEGACGTVGIAPPALIGTERIASCGQ